MGDAGFELGTYIRSRTKNKSGVGPLKVGDRTVTEEQEMAETLNGYFSSVFHQEEDEEVPQAELREARARCRNAQFRPSAIKKIIRGLKPKSAPGPDNITPRVLKELVEEVAVEE